MQSESTKNQLTPKFIHKIPAGVLPDDENIELFADRQSRRVLFTSNGTTKDFKSLSDRYKVQLLHKLMNDPIAWEDLKHLGYKKALTRFSYCVYGSLDHQPDITATGFLGKCDNFICGIPGCNCINWQSKQIRFNDKVIKGRLLEVLLAFRCGREDKLIADRLGITMSTLNTHKKKLFEIFNVGNARELIIAAITEKIIQ